MYCDHCQTTAVEGARFCSSCGGKLTDEPAAGVDLGSAPTVVLTVGPCESCGAPSLPGSTLCLPCTRAFESILGTQPPTAIETAPMPAVAEMATLLVPQASALPSAPGVPPAAAAAQPPSALADDDDEYEDVDDDDLLGEEAATVLAAAPAIPAPQVPPAILAAAPEPAAPPAPEPAPLAVPEPAPYSVSEPVADWSTPTTTADDHEAIVAVLPWARKGPDAANEAVAAAAPEPGPEPTPWWERSGQPSPTGGARPETARYVPPPSAAPPSSSSLESSVARQAMRPKASALPPVVTPRRSGSRSRTLAIAAAVAGVAAIGTPVAWKLAFASRPTVVSMPRSAAPALPAATPEAAPASRPPRQERTHGLPPAEPPRVYHDLQPQEPVAAVTIGKNGIPIASAAVRSSAPATPRPSPATQRPAPATKKPSASATPAAAPAPPPAAATPVVTPAPLPVSAPPVTAAPVAPAPTPAAQVSPEAVPLGQIYEVSQVDKRPAVASSFDPVLPARLAGQKQVVLIVRVLVAPSGRAAEASTVKNPTNDAGVSAAAVATVRQWRFTPATRKGQAVSCWYNVGVVFRPASGD